eukprot:2761019-Amphidinium_carterae.1
MRQPRELSIAPDLQSNTALSQDVTNQICEVELATPWTEALPARAATLRSKARPQEQFDKRCTCSRSRNTAYVTNSTHGTTKPSIPLPPSVDNTLD